MRFLVLLKFLKGFSQVVIDIHVLGGEGCIILDWHLLLIAALLAAATTLTCSSGLHTIYFLQDVDRVLSV